LRPLYRGEFLECVYSNHLTRLRVDERKVDPRWVFYVIYRYWASGVFKILKVTQAGGQKSVGKSVLLKLKLPLPSINEQRAIVGVLSVVDEAIRLTDMVIEKTKRIKKGLMQILFTKGLGHKEYKQTEIGKIPKEWKVVKIGDVIDIRGSKSINIPEKVAFITMEHVPSVNIYCTFEMRERSRVKSYVYCESGDILLAKITPCFENGKQGIVPEDIPNGYAFATTEVFPIIPKSIDRLYLFYILKYPKYRKILEYSMKGTTGRRRVSREALMRLKIPLPPKEEQNKITNILYTIDQKLKFEYKRREKLVRIKRGLMDLLLTGKVRIRV